MNDKEIIKALECCTTNGASCKDCPAFVKVDRSNCKKYFRGALDLINRLEVENERVRLEKADIQRDLQIVCDNSISVKLPHCVLCGKGAILTKSLKDYDELIADISAEAYKEFWQELKRRNTMDKRIVSVATGDNLLKEMVGE